MYDFIYSQLEENDKTYKIIMMPADNKRFGASGGVTSNDVSWEIDRSWF